MKPKKIESFDFAPGTILSRRYEVLEKLGSGWEGEVYKLREVYTGIERAGKFFYPHRRPEPKKLKVYTKRLHKLRHCNILIQYHTQEYLNYRGVSIAYLLSEYVEGIILSEFLKELPGERLGIFQALHLLYALSDGMEKVHRLREYHGDLHTDNIIVKRYGLGFELKLLDLFHWSGASSENILDDVTDLIKIFYESIGGRNYDQMPDFIKDICCGFKRNVIARKFRTAGQLKAYLENMEWGTVSKKRKPLKKKKKKRKKAKKKKVKKRKIKKRKNKPKRRGKKKKRKKKK